MLLEMPVTLAPLDHDHAHQAHPHRDGRIGFTGSTSHPDLRPLHDQMGQRPWVGDALEWLNRIVAENQRRHQASNCHGRTPLRRHSL